MQTEWKGVLYQVTNNAACHSSHLRTFHLVLQPLSLRSRKGSIFPTVYLNYITMPDHCIRLSLYLIQTLELHVSIHLYCLPRTLNLTRWQSFWWLSLLCMCCWWHWWLCVKVVSRTWTVIYCGFSHILVEKRLCIASVLSYALFFIFTLKMTIYFYVVFSTNTSKYLWCCLSEYTEKAIPVTKAERVQNETGICDINAVM